VILVVQIVTCAVENWIWKIRFEHILVSTATSCILLSS
jgi:hypothetical protein